MNGSALRGGHVAAGGSIDHDPIGLPEPRHAEPGQEPIHRVPLVRSVYPYAKKLVEFFLSDKELEFDSVVAAPYPSEDVWAIGFVTGGGLKTLHEELGGRYLSVFIPTSPMPMTGFTVFIDEARLVPLDITDDIVLLFAMHLQLYFSICYSIFILAIYILTAKEATS